LARAESSSAGKVVNADLGWAKEHGVNLVKIASVTLEEVVEEGAIIA
jgi:hypothetical protein